MERQFAIIKNGLHATFMPKPILRDQRIRAWPHAHWSLFAGGTNIFYDAKGPTVQLERDLHDTTSAGILRHAKGFCAITKPGW